MRISWMMMEVQGGGAWVSERAGPIHGRRRAAVKQRGGAAAAGRGEDEEMVVVKRFCWVRE